MNASPAILALLCLAASGLLDLVFKLYSAEQRSRGMLIFGTGCVWILLQLVYIYIFSAILKKHPIWRTEGTAVYYALHVDRLVSVIGLQLREYIGFMKVMTHVTFYLELLGPIFAFIPFGIKYLRLNTDTQQNAYVLRPGETDAPDDLKQALANANRLQDILTGQFEAGKTGNSILADALAQANREGITPSIYTHPIGYHGHAAGPTIGMWDNQGDTPGRGDYPLYPNTAHSIELYAESDVPSWSKAVRIKLEEDAFFDGETTHYIDGRQKEFLLIPREAPVQ